MTWTVAVAIAMGGAVGAPLRHFIDSRVTASLSTERARRFPWGLLAVNALGSLLIGVAYVLADGPWRELLATGAAGALTTYSSYALFLQRSWRTDRGAALWAVFIMPAVCITVAGIGISAARVVFA